VDELTIDNFRIFFIGFHVFFFPVFFFTPCFRLGVMLDE